MQVKISKKEFKAQARRQHQILVERQIPARLSDVQESLAVSLGYRNLAHYYGLAQDAASAEALMTQVKDWSRWVMYLAFDEQTGNEYWALLPEGATLDDVADINATKVRRLLAAAKPFPEGFRLSKETTVLGTYVELPSIEKYGLTPPSDEEKVKAWVVDTLGFRVPKTGLSVSRYDRRDDGAEFIAVRLAVTDADAASIRERMFTDAASSEEEGTFDVRFEATFFAYSREDAEVELSDESIAALNAKLVSFGRKDIVKLVSAHVSADDGQDDEEIHCFASVLVRLKATDEDAAYNVSPPETLLNAVFHELANGNDIDGEWEVLEADLAEE
jgi:hypothetical protein